MWKEIKNDIIAITNIKLITVFNNKKMLLTTIFHLHNWSSAFL